MFTALSTALSLRYQESLNKSDLSLIYSFIKSLTIAESITWTQSRLPIGISFFWPEDTRVSVADLHFTLNQMTSDRLDQVLGNTSPCMDLISYAIHLCALMLTVHSLQCYPRSAWSTTAASSCLVWMGSRCRLLKSQWDFYFSRKRTWPQFFGRCEWTYRPVIWKPIYI